MSESDETKKQVEVFIKELHDKHGLSLDDIRDAVRRNKQIHRWGEWIAKTVITSVTVSLIYAVWEGTKHFIRGH